MRWLRGLGLAIAAGAACFSMFVASASAAEFASSKVGALTATGGTQVFKTPRGTVECKALSGSGTVLETSAVEQLVNISYGKCDLFDEEVTVSPVEYVFSANGTVTIREPIEIKAAAGLCTIKIPAQTVGTVAYGNVSGKIEYTVDLTGVESYGEGTLAECKYAAESNGTYTGKVVVALEGGAMEFAAAAAAAVEFEMVNKEGAFKNPATVGEERTIEVLNVSKFAGTPASMSEGEKQAGAPVEGFFTVTGLAKCRKMLYAAEGSCTFTVKVAKVTKPEEASVKWEALVKENNGKGKVSLNV